MLKANVSDPAAILTTARIQVTSPNLRNEKINTRWGDAYFDSSGRALLAVPESDRHMLKTLGMEYQSEIDADLARTVRSDQQEAVLPRSKTDYVRYSNELEARLVDLREQLDSCATENTELRREADALRDENKKLTGSAELSGRTIDQLNLDLTAAQARVKQLEGKEAVHADEESASVEETPEQKIARREARKAAKAAQR